jgi:hypothetical protein
MSSATKPPGERKTSRLKVQAHRERMRASGMRLVQIWVPDTSDPAFRAQAHRQSALVAASPQDADDQAFIDSISVLLNDDEA